MESKRVFFVAHLEINIRKCRNVTQKTAFHVEISGCDIDLHDDMYVECRYNYNDLNMYMS